MKHIVTILFAALLFTSCEKVIDLDYKSNRSDIVIEGNITNQAGPYFVKITKSIALSESGKYPVIDNAVVTISDDSGNTEILTPEGNGMYSTSATQGVEGRTYTLTVQTEDRIYTAQSTMPQHISLDTIRISEVTLGGDTEYHLIPVYNDPATKGNNYRFVLSVNNRLINQHLVQNDQVRNGLINTVRLEINDDDLKLHPGDSISITMQCIDATAGLYYTTLALMADSGPGGGTTPNNPRGNLSNGALGLFSAHTVKTRSAVIP